MFVITDLVTLHFIRYSLYTSAATYQLDSLFVRRDHPLVS